jgi:glc operon protein GlcG
VLHAAIAEAERIGELMCVSVVDTRGNLLAFGSMDGSKALSVISTRNKAVTTALSNEPRGGVRADVGIQVTLAQENKWTNLVGGIPIRVEGFMLGAVPRVREPARRTLRLPGQARPQSRAQTCSDGRRGHRRSVPQRG